MKNKFTGLALICVAFVIGGCATGPMKAAQKAGIKNVTVERRVDVKEGMRYGIEMQGGLGNALADMIIDSAGQNGISRMSDVMASNNIVVPDMVHERAVKTISECDTFHLDNVNPDGVFLFSIVQYGFDNQELHLSRKFPFIMLHGELRDRQGKVVWNRDSTVLQHVDDASATWDEFEDQPELLRTDWTKQIDNILGQLLDCGQ